MLRPACRHASCREFRTRLSLLRPDVNKSVRDRQTSQKVLHDRRARARSFVVGDRVLARNLRPGPDWIRGTIVEVLGPVTYIVEIDGGQRWKRHIDQLKDWLAPIVGERNSEESTSERAVVDPDTMEPNDEPSDTFDDTPSAEEGPQSAPLPPSADLSPPSPGPAERRYPSRNRHPPDFYS